MELKNRKLKPSNFVFYQIKIFNFPESPYNNFFHSSFRIFENKAFNILESSNLENQIKAKVLLLRNINSQKYDYKNTSCFKIALSAGLEDFVSHPAAQKCLNDLWFGEINFSWNKENFLNNCFIVIKV